MALTLPSGFKAVGIRYGQHQVTNRGQDQSFVFAMLKAIPEAQGGARQQLAGESVPILGDGTCSEFLAGLILRFQRSAPSLGAADGVVDAAGATLRLMMQRAGASGALPPAGPSGGSVPNTESALPPQRRALLLACANATQATGGGPRKPSAEELRGFFATARTEAVPTLAEAQKSLAQLSSGCYIQGSTVRHWCGIFACAVAVSAGFGAFRWTLNGGRLLGPRLIMGHRDILPGDIAIIAQHNHHFLVTSFPDGGKLRTLEGNTTGQLIRRSEKKLADIVGFYRTVPL
jgi:hypothetical protein